MLTLKTKNARFEWVDDDVESVVTLSSVDDEATLVRKLKRIIELVEVHQGQEGNAALLNVVPPLPRGAASALDKAYEGTVATNGWAAAYGPPALPERLLGEVELIPPGEDA